MSMAASESVHTKLNKAKYKNSKRTDENFDFLKIMNVLCLFLKHTSYYINLFFFQSSLCFQS